MAKDIVNLMDALNIKQAVFAGYDWGARTADIVAALWPERVKSLVSVSGYLISSQQIGKQPLPPKAEQQWWYQFYFATERGAEGYAKNTHDFARLIWSQASPDWKFSDATFNASAKSLDNPDHVAVTLSNYRWRLGLEKGERKYDSYEQNWPRCRISPSQRSPSKADNNGAPHPAPQAYRVNLPVNINTVPSAQPWGTIRLRKIRRISSRRLRMRPHCSGVIHDPDRPSRAGLFCNTLPG